MRGWGSREFKEGERLRGIKESGCLAGSCVMRGLEGRWPVVRELKVKTVTGEVLGRVANGS